jgi:hypothetical protein
MHLKKLMAVCLSVALIITSTPPREVEASWFSDLMGGLFTVITSPILLVAPHNPTLRKNNPFRKKMWEEEAERREREEDKKEIANLKRLSSQQAATASPQTIVIEKETTIIREAAPNNSTEINALRNEVAELKKNVEDKTTEISILQHIVSNVRNGKDGRDGLDGKNGIDGQCFSIPEKISSYKFSPTYIVIDDGNTSRIVREENEPATQLVVPTNERDKRKFLSMVGVTIISYYIAKFFYVMPFIDRIDNEYIYADITPKKNIFLKSSAIVLVQYFGHKFNNRKLTVNEIWTDAKDLTSDVGNLFYDIGNWTVSNVPAATGVVRNKTKELVNVAWDEAKNVNPETVWKLEISGLIMLGVCAIIGAVFLYGLYARKQRAKEIGGIDMLSSVDFANIKSP